MAPIIVTLALGIAASAVLTGLMRRYALQRRLVDIPNHRSSHSAATPRGGGAAIVLVTLGGLVAAAATGVLPSVDLTALTVSGALVALVGFVDDHGHLARRVRLLAHVGAAALVVWRLGPLPPLPLTATIAIGSAGVIGAIVAAVYVVWIINAANFMDGIDGIAAVEAITVGLGAAACAVAAHAVTAHWVAPLLLAAAATGFLPWNWPPARIFMGDVGSGFLGLMLAALSLQAGVATPRLFWCWVIMLSVFITDASVTLVRRAVSGHRVWEPHRTHAYQHAAARLGSHKAVTLAVAAINLVWLLPLAMLVAVDAASPLVAVAVAYVPLVVAVTALGGGVAAEKRPIARVTSRV